MSLEAKAKTSSDIFHSYPYDCRNLSEYGRVTKWVPLEEAQKAIETEKDEQFIQDYKATVFKINSLKIEANKILDEIIAKCQDRYDVDTCEKCCDKKCCEEYEIRAILIPRKEPEAIKE